MLLQLNLISYSQTFSTEQDSIKCFTTEQARTLLRYAEKGYLCDSLTQKYEQKIETLSEVVSLKDQEIILSSEFITLQMNEINELRKSIKWLKFGCGAFGGSTLILFILLIIK